MAYIKTCTSGLSSFVNVREGGVRYLGWSPVGAKASSCKIMLYFGTKIKKLILAGAWGEKGM